MRRKAERSRKRFRMSLVLRTQTFTSLYDRPTELQQWLLAVENSQQKLGLNKRAAAGGVPGLHIRLQEQIMRSQKSLRT